MGNNAIIFGAGASYDAKIPMIDTFIEKLRGYALRGFAGNQSLNEKDVDIFKDAMAVMYQLNEYHRGASFNDMNLEDLLSILSFNILGKDNSDSKKLDQMIDAIVRTIELSCEVKHNGRLNASQREGSELYRAFWNCMFNEWKVKKSIPIIITLNYDLVLERSLFQSLIDSFKMPFEFPFDGIVLDYKYKYLPKHCYKLVQELYTNIVPPREGVMLVECKDQDLKNPMIIELLKLHGSLNFPLSTMEKNSGAPTNVVEKPLLIPPISIKPINDEMTDVWNSALTRLREVKNLIIVGYSLPRTDTYMQYFLKTALGPNKDFQKLIVFNPKLFEENDDAKEMMQRYSGCFSEQVRNYITYKPKNRNELNGIKSGTFFHFVDSMSNDYGELFF